MKSILSSLPKLMPIVYDWAEKQESLLLAEGVPLTESQLSDARRAGVNHPEKIRLSLLKKIPEPENEEITFLAKQVGLFKDGFSGMTLGYAICLKEESWNDRYTLVHECVHVSQHEKLNGLRSFLCEYVRECIDPGYPFGSLEQEAVVLAKDICKPTTARLPR
jgi:hypothetical protein